LCAKRAAHAETKREFSALTDTLDLMRDEFQRIVARMVESGTIITDVGQEILTICNRARSQIAQRVPVIAQRDAAESRVRELEGLASQVVKAWKAFDLVDGDWERTDSERALANSIDTLGEAMPRKNTP